MRYTFHGVRLAGWVALAGLMAAVACAPKTIPAPRVTTPRYPEFVPSAVPSSFAGTGVALSQDRGWRFLQAGDLANAQREFSLALKSADRFYPAETGLGYVALARENPKEALSHFERSLEQAKGDVGALVGRGEALTAMNRPSDALAALQAALAVDPSLSEVSRRIDLLKFRSVEAELGRAQSDARAGRLDDAVTAYRAAIASSPDSPLLYRELAGIERRQGNDEQALQDFRKAVSLDPSDVRSLSQIGELSEARGDYEQAEASYKAVVAVEPSAENQAKLEAVRGRMELARMPEQYRAIDGSSEVTRADLAALIGVRLAALVQASRQPETTLITDVRNSWAATWILAVARAGIMEPFPNHTFQPSAPVRRIDLAGAVSKLLSRIPPGREADVRAWQEARITFADLSNGHLSYPAASEAVASGVMKVGPGNTFQPSRVVDGAEALEVIGHLQALSASGTGRGAAR
jgi:tetratricopeptide (TPR) repeat protein